MGIETRKFYGSVTYGEHHLGTHFCELTADPYNARDMRVEVHLAEGDDQPNRAAFIGWGVPHFPGKAMRIEGPGMSVETSTIIGSHLEHSGWRLAARVMSAEWRDTIRTGQPAVYEFGYRFPLTATASRMKLTAKLGNVGYIRGRVKEDDDGVMTVKPVLPFAVVLDGVEIEVGSTFNFHESGSTRYPAEHVVSESFMGFKLLATEPEPVERARALASAVLRLFSVAERDRIHWTRENYYSQDANGAPLTQVRSMRWASPPVDRRSLPWGGDHEGTLKTLVAAYDLLDAGVRSEVDRACGEFEIAATAGDIETSLIRWHSVVDFFSKRAGNDKGNAGHRIVKTCDDLGVLLDDLVDTELAETLRAGGKGAFPFTDLRNRFVHDGFDVFDDRFDELLKARKTVRAVAERMLLARMGIGREGTHIGTATDQF